MSRRIEQIIIAGIAVVIVFTALAHGAVEPWSVAVYSLLVVLLLELWAVRMIIEKSVPVTIPAIALPLVAAIVFGLIQMIPINGRRVTWDVESTRSALISMTLLLGSVLLYSNFLMTRTRLRRTAYLLTLLGAAIACFGLIQHYSWNGKFYWLRPLGTPTSPFGPFLNHSNFAGYMELLAPIPVGLVIAGALRGAIRLPALFCGALMSVATIISLSRGGMIGLLAGFGFLAAAAIARARRRDIGDVKPGWLAQLAAVLVVIGAVLAGLFWLGPDAVIDRVVPVATTEADLEKQTFQYSRGWIWRDTMAMIRANPVAGVGLGAYGTAYPAYAASDGSLRVEAAHNEFLQALSDGGLIGAAIGIWFLIILLRSIARAAASNDRLHAGLALGCGAGIFSVLVHSAFDFNLHLPSNSLVFMLLAAVASHIAATEGEEALETVELPEQGLIFNASRAESSRTREGL